jgi:hypothetical protein
MNSCILKENIFENISEQRNFLLIHNFIIYISYFIFLQNIKHLRAYTCSSSSFQKKKNILSVESTHFCKKNNTFTTKKDNKTTWKYVVILCGWFGFGWIWPKEDHAHPQMRGDRHISTIINSIITNNSLFESCACCGPHHWSTTRKNWRERKFRTPNHISLNY